MSRVDDLSTLRRCRGGHTICVQVVREWRTYFPKVLGERRFVFADQKGSKMAVTIRGKDRDFFGDVLKEGKWYWMYDFEVNIKAEEAKFSRHEYQIFINPETIVWEAKDVRVSRMFDLVSFDRIATSYERINVVDVLGVVVRVHFLESFPRTVSPYFQVPAYQCLHFVLKDFEGRILHCVAKDGLATKFREMWIQTIVHSRVVCILRLWDISNFEGKLALFGSKDYSDILLDYDCPEVKDAKERAEFTDEFDSIIDAYLEYPGRD